MIRIPGGDIVMVFGFLRRLLGPDGARRSSEPRARLAGTVRVADREWSVREERRAGAWPQLVILADAGSETELHLRVREGEEIQALDDVAARAENPTAVWFTGSDGERWEARIVWSDAPGGKRLKFIRWPAGVHETDYPFDHGLGLCTDAQLRKALDAARSAPSS